MAEALLERSEPVDSEAAAEQAQLKALLEKIADGNQAAFQVFYEKTSPRSFGLAMQVLGNRAQAQDLLQEVYLRVWSSAGDYDAGRGPVTYWLLMLVRHRAIDQLRSEARRDNLHDAHHENLQFAATTSDSTIKDSLMWCLDQLAGLQRQSIVEAFFHGWTYEELAEKVAAPLGTVKSRVRRGLARLRECLQQ